MIHFHSQKLFIGFSLGGWRGPGKFMCPIPQRSPGPEAALSNIDCRANPRKSGHAGKSHFLIPFAEKWPIFAKIKQDRVA